MVSFSLFTPLTTQKIKVLKNWKKYLDILSFYTCVPYIHDNMKIIWYMVPEILSATPIIYCHFGLFFALSPLQWPRKSHIWKKEENSWRYFHFASTITDNRNWQMMYGSWDKECEKPGYIIILHMCTINDNHIMYGSCFLSFWTVFCPFTPLTTQKIKILKKWKKKKKKNT